MREGVDSLKNTNGMEYSEEASRGSYIGRMWETLSEEGKEVFIDFINDLTDDVCSGAYRVHDCTEKEVAYLFAGVSAARGYTPEVMAKRFEEDPAKIYGDVREEVKELLNNRVVLDNMTVYHTKDLCIITQKNGAWFVPFNELEENKYLGIDLSTTGRSILMKIGRKSIKSETIRETHNYKKFDPAVHKKFTEKVRDLIYGRGLDELKAGAPPERRMTKEFKKTPKKPVDPLFKAVGTHNYKIIEELLGKGIGSRRSTDPEKFFEELFEEK